MAFVAPDFFRAQAAFFQRHGAQVKTGTTAGVVHQLGKGVGQTARAHIVNRQNRVGSTQLRALVNHLLRAALDLGVAALNRIKIKLCRVGTRGHGAGSTAAHADAHAGATQLNQQSASRKQDFFCQGSVNGAQAACDHDGLVVTPALAVHGLLVLAKVTRQVGPAEFIVEGGAAQRAVGHDL